MQNKRPITLFLMLVAVGCTKPTATSAVDGGDAAPPAPETWREHTMKALATLRESDVPRWTSSVVRDRERSREEKGCGDGFQRKSCEEDTESFCPAVKPIRLEKESDEFARKDRDRRFDAARVACVRELTAKLGPLPKLVILDALLRPFEKYNFEKHGFVLEFVRDDHSPRWGAADTWQFSSVKDCSPRPPSDGFLAVGGMTNADFAGEYFDPVKPGASILVVLKVPEAQGPAMKERLLRDSALAKDAGLANNYASAPTKLGNFLHLELLFEPAPYGATSAMCTRSAGGQALGTLPMEGFRGKGVGYRIVDAEGVVVEWQQLGS